MFPTPFSTHFEKHLREPRTTAELRMLAFSQAIREKERWAEKLDSSVREHWREEALAQGLTEDQVNYVFDELKHYVSIAQDKVEPAAVDGTWQADGLIERSLKEEFLTAARDHLESTGDKDYHPWSNNQVVDLVHPSLYCYVEGVTQVANIEEGIEYFRERHADFNKSKASRSATFEEKRKYMDSMSMYRWLPAEVSLSAEGKASITSYINNMNPSRCDKLYRLVERIFEKFVPLFNRVLTDLLNPTDFRVHDWYEGEEPHIRSDESSSSFERRYEEEWQNPDKRVISWGKIKFRARKSCEKEVDIRGKSLQVIVKLAYIELTPETPCYPGGNWHVEGTENEAIVATGIFYYASSNISQSRLFFREAVSNPDRYLQNDEEGVRQVYGMKDQEHLNQVLGSIVTVEDRCLVFPNIYQHKVSPFELEDKTKDGHRKILAFFLVDPGKRVISTKHVLPQQKAWRKADDQKGTMTLEKAREYREELMKTRKYAVASVGPYGEIISLYEREFSLCEH